mgnify:CR=1 FL=1
MKLIETNFNREKDTTFINRPKLPYLKRESDFARANLYEATFLPRSMIDLQEVSRVGFLSTNKSFDTIFKLCHN